MDTTTSHLDGVNLDIAEHKRAIVAHERELTRLRGELELLERYQKYLTSGLPTGETPPTLPADEPLTAMRSAESYTADAIGLFAEEFLRKAPSKQARAIDIAVAMLPGYDPDQDGRKFENRVYSALKRRGDRFKRVDEREGYWTLGRADDRPGKATRPPAAKGG